MTIPTVPEGFRAVDAEAVARPNVEMIDYEVFQANGAKVLYGGIVDLAPGRERSDVHTVRGHKEPDGQLYGIWRCASLDLQLRGCAAGTLLFLRYHGKVESEKGFTEHKWTVALPEKEAAAHQPRGDKRRRPASFD